MRGRVIWKVGGSVLAEPASYGVLAARIRRYLKQEPLVERLYVVVSAIKGSTNAAVAQLAPREADRETLTRILNGQPVDACGVARWDRADVAAALLQGEIDSAHILRAALAHEGVPARAVTQHDSDYPIVASGSYLRAEVNLAKSARRFAVLGKAAWRERVTVVSGFGGVNEAGEPVLLGRNASDYVAAILSVLDSRIGSVVFLKDVAGLYDGFGTADQRLIESIDADRLRTLDTGRLLDRRVLDIIRCDFRIAGAGLDSGTTVRIGCGRSAGLIEPGGRRKEA